MTSSNLTPTRMERLRQRGRLQTATHAHKLLKDKSDEMLRTFTQLIKQNKTLRERVEKDLTAALSLFMTAAARLSTTAVDDALAAARRTVTITCDTRNIMGLVVPHVEVQPDAHATTPVLITTTVTFDEALNKLQALTATLLELANIEKTCSMLADEIQKVRRRINSLEYKMIPEIESNIKFITMKLDETQREAQVRAMKVKDLQTPDE